MKSLTTVRELAIIIERWNCFVGRENVLVNNPKFSNNHAVISVNKDAVNVVVVFRYSD